MLKRAQIGPSIKWGKECGSLDVWDGGWYTWLDLRLYALQTNGISWRYGMGVGKWIGVAPGVIEQYVTYDSLYAKP